MKTRILPVIVALILISCEKRDPELDSKLSQLEKQAAEAVERQRQLEEELAEQKILAERDAIERERTLIEQERIAMDELRNADNAENANALAQLQKRQLELMERDRKISENQRELNDREQKLTGLEDELSERELDLAGREPLDALPPIEKNYVSGPTGDYNNFYEPLAAYGSWLQTNDYGYVYQPTVVRDVSWRPYTRGRWAFTNHGWTWVSNEPFGWACYHYGRWSLLRNIGWVWIPGNQWAPAWVSWRESPGYIGWAPLPPETIAWSSNSWDSSVDVRFGIDSGWFSFISYRNFGNDIHTHCLPYAQNAAIYHSTTTVTHYVIQDRRVYCGGPRYRNVCDRIGRRFPIHQLRLDHCPDFGRGGRRLHSQFSGNELQVVAPRMDADWNRALRPSRISRDLGEVVVNRSTELPEDVRKQYRDRKHEEDEKAARWVTDSGGREAFENNRKTRLEKNREEVVKNESLRPDAREPYTESNKKNDRSKQPLLNETTGLPTDESKKPKDRGSKRPVRDIPETLSPETPTMPASGTPTIPNPEIPAVPETRTPTVPNPEIPEAPSKRNPTIPNPEIPTIPDTGKNPLVTGKPEIENNKNRQEKPNRLPPGVIPMSPVTENNLGEKRSDSNENSKRPQIPDNRNTDLKNETEKQATRELRLQEDASREERLRLDRELKLQQEQQVDLTRQQQLEARKAQQKQEELEQAQRQQQEKQEKLNQELEQKGRVREQKEQGEKLREQQEMQENARKEQQDKLREQQEQARDQKEKLREQQGQQEEAQRRMQEQQEKQRAQQEQQEKMRAQQEQQERQRAQQEQQERARQQQEEAQRQMQEQQEKQRAQQEQQERQRAQQEQQERARQQQEESQRRMQEQQERQRAQQEQQERQRAQQEQQEGQRAQQERARQQQEESQRRKQEQ